MSEFNRYIFIPNRDSVEFVATGFTDIVEKIIPFFNKYQIEGLKALDFADFRKVSEIMKVKGHLTDSGLEQIRIIKAGMTTLRSLPLIHWRNRRPSWYQPIVMHLQLILPSLR